MVLALAVCFLFNILSESMALALLDTFDFKESASDDFELEVWLDFDELV